MADLILSKARQVDRAELALVTAPAPTLSWFPLSHIQVIDQVERTLAEAGLSVERSVFGLSRGDHRFFAALDLRSDVAEGVKLSVGVRNSTDKSLPIGFCAGSRVLVCDNLAFRSEVVIARKHTRNGEIRFAEALSKAISGLHFFREQERQRVLRLQQGVLDDRVAESLVLRAWEADIVSHRTVPSVLRHWREPEHPDFAARTYWSLFNAFTASLAPFQQSNFQRFTHLTILLSNLFNQALGE